MDGSNSKLCFHLFPHLPLLSRKPYTTTFHEKPTTMIGKVKWFDSKKGYGFILNEEGREIFVHYTGIVADGFKALAEGQNVEFEIEKNDKGEQAVNVTVLHKK